MKPKNVMLLGFVNRAVEFLDKHMDEEPDKRLAELKNIDLASLKDELSDNLDASLGTMQSTMSTLLKAGNEAFDDFIEGNLGKASIPDQFNRLFDVDLDSKESKNQKELARLLSFYNLESDYNEEVEEDIKKAPEQNYEDQEETLEEIRKNTTNDDIEEIMPIEKDSSQGQAIDSIFNEIVEHEATVKTNVNNVEHKQEVIKEIPITSEEKEELVDETKQTQSYVSSLIDDLRTQLLKEEAKKKEEDTRNTDIYFQVSKIYPYLPEAFIRSVFELKESIASEYVIGSKIIVLHRIKFKDVDNLRKFVEISLNHQYTINADEKKMIVDIFKEFINTDGKILTNIYEVANQGYLLNGEYDGYNIIVEEDE